MNTNVIHIITADYNNTRHAQDIITLLDNYAQDPMGGNQPLSQYTKDNLIQ